MQRRCRPHIACLLAIALCSAAAPDTSAQGIDRPKPEHNAQPASQPEAERAEPRVPSLTAAAAEMRELIADSASRGAFSDMRLPIEWNELPPDFGPGDGLDPLEKLKAQSADGSGYDVLANIITVLSLPHTVVPLGTDPENPNVFVFPYLSTRDLAQLTPPEIVDLYRLMGASDAAAMIKSGDYTGWVLTIGADGTWHSFRRQPPKPAEEQPATRAE